LVFDAWIQHPTSKLLEQPMFGPLLRMMGITEMPKELPLEFTLGALDAAGIDQALVTAWYGPHGAIISNDQVASLVNAGKGRLIGAASVNLHRPVAAVKELRRAVKELGLRALRMLPWLWEAPPDDRRYYPLYATCVELGVPFCLQVGHTLTLGPSEAGRPIPYLDRVALDFPELTIVAGHVGFPWTEEMIALATKYENVFIDTSGYKPRRYPASLRDYVRSHGREKVLFGSNFPMINPADCVEEVGELGLDEDVRELFLGGNAARVFKLSS
jgi:hypothetical protein